jgi:hypothetical protein
VVKPLSGYGGSDVFLVGEDASNLRQIVESVSRSGYIVAQEFLPAATEGDTRLFLVNGKPLEVDGRTPPSGDAAGGDFRSNMSAGGRPEKVEVDDTMLRLASIVGPKLIKDGIFFAGLDIVGDKLVEINTISSGGLNIAGKLQERDFGTPSSTPWPGRCSTSSTTASTSGTSSWRRSSRPVVGGQGGLAARFAPGRAMVHAILAVFSGVVGPVGISNEPDRTNNS